MKFDSLMIFDRNFAQDCNLFSLLNVSNNNDEFIEFHKFLYFTNNEIYSINDICL